MAVTADTIAPPAPRLPFPRLSAGLIGWSLFTLIALPCVATLPWSTTRSMQDIAPPRVAPLVKPAVARLDVEIQNLETRKAMLSSRREDVSQVEQELVIRQSQRDAAQRTPWAMHEWISMLMGTDSIGRSLFWRCLLGGAISLGVGLSAALISVIIGVTWGAMSGLAGGRIDAGMMRFVDILYGLPYILLVVLVKIALQPAIKGLFAAWNMNAQIADGISSIVTLLIAIGGVSWLTMARVIRGQVLSLRAQSFVEAARACGAGPLRILRVHLLPNLIGPIVVYTTLTVPTAILQESFLSFLGIGVQLPLPSWGNLAAEGVKELHTLALPGASFKWWMTLWPCALLGLTLMALNFLGDALRNRLDPRSAKR